MSTPIQPKAKAKKGRKVKRVPVADRDAAAAWRPSANQERLLAAVASGEASAGNMAELVAASKLSRFAVYEWFQNIHFRAWWNEQLLELARLRVGPAMAILDGIMSNPMVADSVRVRAVEAMLKANGGVRTDKSTAASVLAIIEKYRGDRRLRVVADGQRLAAELSEIAAETGDVGSGDLAENRTEGQATPHKTCYQNVPAIGACSPEVVAEAVQATPASEATAKLLTAMQVELAGPVRRQRGSILDPSTPIRVPSSGPARPTVLRGRGPKSQAIADSAEAPRACVSDGTADQASRPAAKNRDALPPDVDVGAVVARRALRRSEAIPGTPDAV